MRRALAVSLLLLLSASTARAEEKETLRYRWSLDGFLGLIASLFMPTEGDGTLTFEPAGPGVVRGVLEVTSSKSESGEFFRYGAEWERPGGRTLRAWTDQFWRGESKSKRAEVGDAGVIDIVSGIDLLRRLVPTTQRRLEIWSDGKRYPVVVLPREREELHIAGRDVETNHLSVLGVALPDRSMWRGQLDLWFAEDAVATPVQIVVSHRGARVRLTLSEYPASGDLPAASPPRGGG